MKFTRTREFVKQYARLQPKIQAKVDKQLVHLAAYGIYHPDLSVRKMTGFTGIWEARVNGHYRFTFQIQGDEFILRKVGTHEIYRKP